jgi:hypothetical protein
MNTQLHHDEHQHRDMINATLQQCCLRTLRYTALRSIFSQPGYT